jgi:hypothetical protein
MGDGRLTGWRNPQCRSDVTWTVTGTGMGTGTLWNAAPRIRAFHKTVNEPVHEYGNGLRGAFSSCHCLRPCP